jgi:hypothetical protein
MEACGDVQYYEAWKSQADMKMSHVYSRIKIGLIQLIVFDSIFKKCDF